ncbi:hypothetical protein [Nonlabens sp.]|uniref:hypothetical protein n=1 Tax=Nonlabens sp. TaxID=1888209 RepID=UPI001BCFC6C1|nr:hypothetical protein [Nonlabens sp.]
MKDLEFHAFGFEHFDNSNEAIVLDDAGFDNVKKGQGGFIGTPSETYKFKTSVLYNDATQHFMVMLLALAV